MDVKQAWNFDDVHLVPQHSALPGRASVSLQTRIGWLDLDVPLISAAMDTVTDWEMASWMRMQGALGIIHRYMSLEDQVESVIKAGGYREEFRGVDPQETVAVSVGVNGDAMDRALTCVESGAGVVVLDVAHGDTLNALKFISELRGKHSDIIISSGNIVTVEAARRNLDAGADTLRVGLGSGSACETTTLTGVGYPQLSAVSEIRSAFRDTPILSDGGCRGPADVVKVLAAGADAVISGRLFYKYPWTLRGGEYRGMASAAALKDYKGDTAHAPEGVSYAGHEIYTATRAQQDFDTLVAHIKLGLSYLGARDLQELRSRAEWVQA